LFVKKEEEVTAIKKGDEKRPDSGIGGGESSRPPEGLLLKKDLGLKINQRGI